MKTIQLIVDCINNMQTLKLPADLQIGTFKVISKGHLINWCGTQGQYTGSKILFKIKFTTQHIQHLIDLGVEIDFSSVKMADLSEKALRFKKGRDAIKQGRYAPYYYMGNPVNYQTGVIENWLIADAKADINTLKLIEKYCRENHRDIVFIDNDHNLKSAGWPFKTKYTPATPILLTKTVAKRIRQKTNGKRVKLKQEENKFVKSFN